MTATPLLAIYDLDRTITRIPTWTPFLLHAARRHFRWRLALVPVAAGAALLHVARAFDRHRLKQIMHRLMLGGRLPAATASILADDFARALADKAIYADVRQAIAADRAAGYRIVIATAAYGFYATAIARLLDVDDLVATAARVDDAGNILPEIDGENCYGPAKLRMIERWMADHRIDRRSTHIRFYSDHISDLPTFEWADEPFVVNPRARLHAIATARRWPVMAWRA